MKCIGFVGFAVATLANAESKPNIVELAESVTDLSTLVAALVGGDLVTTLSSPGPFTVFAPTNEAFSGLPAGTLDDLMKPANKAQLVDLLTYHVVPGNILSTDLQSFQAVKTVEGKPLHVVKWGGVVQLGPSLEKLSNVTAADNKASNGVVHIINGVLIPPAAPPPMAAIVITESKGFYDCSGTVRSSFDVIQDTCYKLADVPTSKVNVDQTVHCLDNGDFEVTTYKSSDGTCNGTSAYPTIRYKKGFCISNLALGLSGPVTVKCPEAVHLV